MMPTTTPTNSNPQRADAHAAVQYSPALLRLLEDAIPLICNSKMETILFFLSAGVPESWLADMKKQVETCRSCITKFSIAQEVLAKLNHNQEDHLRELHRVVKRVTDFEDFSTCGPIVRQKATQLVAEVRGAAGVDGAFARQKPLSQAAAQGAGVCVTQQAAGQIID